VSPGAVIVEHPNFWPFQSDKFCNFQSFTLKSWIHSKYVRGLFFSFLHKKHVIITKHFPLNFLTILPKEIFFYHFTHKIYYVFLLVSPIEMVSSGAARPLRPRLSTPLMDSFISRAGLSLRGPCQIYRGPFPLSIFSSRSTIIFPEHWLATIN